MSIHVGFQTVKYSSESFRNTLQIDIPNKTCSVVGIMSARVGISVGINTIYTNSYPMFFGDNIIIQNGRVFISAHGYDYWQGLIPGRSGFAGTNTNVGTIYMFNLEGEDTITFNRNLFLPDSNDNTSSRDWNAIGSANYELSNSYANYLYTDRRSVLYQTQATSGGSNPYHYRHSIYDGGGAVNDSTLRAVGRDNQRGIPRTSLAFSDRYVYLPGPMVNTDGSVSVYYNRGVVGFQTALNNQSYGGSSQQEKPIFDLNHENIFNKQHTRIIDKFYTGHTEYFSRSDDWSPDYVYRIIATGCGRLAVGAPHNTWDTQNASENRDKGSVSIFTLDTLRHIATIEPPNLYTHWDYLFFGGSIAIGAGIIVVGASEFSKGSSSLDYDDPVYVYDLNGQFITYIDNPTLSESVDISWVFGRKITIKNNLLYINAVDRLDNGGRRDLVYIYDTKTFDLIDKIYHPWVDWSLAAGPTYTNVNKQDFPFQNFGCEMVAEDSKLIIGANTDDGTSVNGIQMDDPTSGSAVLYKMHENYDTYYQSIIENYRY